MLFKIYRGQREHSLVRGKDEYYRVTVWIAFVSSFLGWLE